MHGGVLVPLRFPPEFIGKVDSAEFCSLLKPIRMRHYSDFHFRVKKAGAVFSVYEFFTGIDSMKRRLSTFRQPGNNYRPLHLPVSDPSRDDAK